MKKIISTVMCFFIALSLSAQFNFSIELNDNKYPIETTGKRFVIVSKDTGVNYGKITHDTREDISFKFPDKNKMIISGKRGIAVFNISNKTKNFEKEGYTGVFYDAIDSNGEICAFANIVEKNNQYIYIEYKNRILIYE